MSTSKMTSPASSLQPGTELESMDINAIRKVAKELGLKAAGKKPELIEAIRATQITAEAEQEAAIAEVDITEALPETVTTAVDNGVDMRALSIGIQSELSGWSYADLRIEADLYKVKGAGIKAATLVLLIAERKADILSKAGADDVLVKKYTELGLTFMEANPVDYTVKPAEENPAIIAKVEVKEEKAPRKQESSSTGRGYVTSSTEDIAIPFFKTERHNFAVLRDTVLREAEVGDLVRYPINSCWIVLSKTENEIVLGRGTERYIAKIEKTLNAAVQIIRAK